MAIVKKIIDFIFLFVYFQKKKEDFVTDLYFESWNTLSEKDIGRYKMDIPLANGKMARFVLIKIEKVGIVPQGVYFDLEFIDDYPYIRNCSFREFYKLYKDTILFMVDNEEVIDYGY